MELAHCPNCDLVFNAAFDPEKMAYSPQYENSLDGSARFREYRGQLVDRLVADFELKEKRIVEIGCGRGDFLRLLADVGDNDCLGFDPSFDAEVDPPPTHPNVTIRSENYGPKHRGFDAELVCCRHVLEHISEPFGFVRSVQGTIKGGSKTGVYFEVPNALYTLEHLGIWDLIYEHCLYFTPPALTALFRRAGFNPIRVDSVYDGQFLSIDATTDLESEHNIPANASCDTERLVGEFKTAYETKVAHWKKQFDQWAKDSTRAVIWGAGSKGVTFLNVMNAPYEVIAHAVDVNPRKQGRFVTGTGQEIVSPTDLVEIKPDKVIIMNAIYKTEIEAQLAEMKIAAEVLVV
ncbi:MAG: SAM-dependent methyltransferase [Phycisphaerae bacterium]|nr:MAG: SAM-dependent methyltransferase [Phycisphaerae bacterium]